jgi:hypothetical protein
MTTAPVLSIAIAFALVIPYAPMQALPPLQFVVGEPKNVEEIRLLLSAEISVTKA